MKLFRLSVETLRRDITRDSVFDGDDNPDMARIKRRLTVVFGRFCIIAGVGMVIADDLFGAVTQLAHQIELDFSIDEKSVAPVPLLGNIGTGLDAGELEVSGAGLMADQQAAALLGVGSLGGFGDGSEQIFRNSDHR